MRTVSEGAEERESPQRVETMRVVKLLDIVQSDPPFIVVFERIHMRGKERGFTQEVKVFDSRLFQRLLAEARKGEKIEAVIVTEFAERGYSTYLADFSRQG
jgi:hypothetical protein